MTDSNIGDEIWKPIPGHNGYEASSLGRIRSVSRIVINVCGVSRRYSAKILKATTTAKGRRVVGMKYKQRYVSHLVLLAFIGPRPYSYQCCHSNGNSQDDRIENLRWDTIKSNNNDRKKHLTSAGSRNWNAVLTERDVVEIRMIFASNPKPDYHQIGKRFGISVSAATKVCRRETWKHID